MKIRWTRFVLVILAIAAVILAFLYTPVTETINSDNDLWDMAVDQQSDTFCQNIKTEDIKDACFLSIAKSTNDCKFIIDPRTKNACTAFVAKHTGDASICKNIEDDTFNSDLCYKDAAINSNESDNCQGIQLQTTKNECYTTIALALSDSEICKEMPDTPSSLCFKAIAEKTNDIELCGEITESVSKNACRLSIAVAIGEKEYCEFISLKTIKDKCLEVLS